MKPLAIVFDLFGTLLDIASLATAAARYTSDGAAFVAAWREKQLSYAFTASLMNRYEDFDAITADALEYTASRYGLSEADGVWASLANEWRSVRPFDDALATLVQLRERGLRCAVLTNGTLQTAHAALHSAGLTDFIDVTLSVDAVRVYKPDARVYTLATTHFATTPERLAFVTSNGWDATGAAEFGMRVVWCNRAQAPAETFGTAPARTIGDLYALADIIEQIPDRGI